LKVFSVLVLALCLLVGCSSAQQQAPATYKVNLDLSTGPVVIEVTRADAPLGADHFYQLVKAHYFDGARFFRVIPGFMAQFGIAADPAVTKKWETSIQDDPVKQTNARGTVVFAATSQLFINTGEKNAYLDGMGFAPFGKVISGMEAVDKINAEYKENPDQEQATNQGNAYLEKEFPRLDYIKTARIVE
jgi:peptidyl-prolyl cis-trans isomerase A (cyclophilin A)